MNIEKTSSALILRSNNLLGWIFLMIFFAFPFLAFGIIPLLVPYEYTLTCQRQVENLENNECKLIKSGLLWSNETLISVDQLKGAKIDVNHNEGTTYQLVVVLEKEQEYFGWGDGNLKEKECNKNQINKFIKNQNIPALEIRQSGHPLAGIMFLFVGIFLLYGCFRYPLIEYYELDKNQRIFLLERSYFCYTYSTLKNLDDLSSVKIFEKDDAEGGSFYELYLIDRYGNEIFLHSFGSNQNIAIKVSESIRQFLGLET